MAYKKSKGRLLGDLFGKASIFTRETDDSVRIDTESSGVVSSSTTVANTAFQSALANTNSYIATKVNTSTFNSALANTNSYIATKTGDATAIATNTALRTLISDRIQVANLNSTLSDYWPSANVISHVSTELSALVDSAPSTLDTLNELAAALGDDANFSTTVTNSLASKATWTALTSTNTAIRTLVSDRMQVANLNSTLSDYWPSANVISYVAASAGSGGASVTVSDTAPSSPSAGDLWFDSTNLKTYVYYSSTWVQTNPTAAGVSNAYLTSTYTSNAVFQAFVANTNAAIASAGGEVSNAYLTSTFTTNTAFQSALANTNLAINDRMQVANVTSAISTAIANLVDTAPSTLDTLNELAAALGDDANFSATVTTSLAGKASNAAFQSALANTNAYIATKTDDTVALATNTALRTLISDRMQVANVISYTSKYLEVANSASLGEVSNSYLTSTYTTNTAFQSFVANTNAYIATVAAAPSGLSNSEVENIVDARINVLDLGDVVGTDGNAGQILISYGDGTAYWSNNNPSVDLSGYVGNTYLQSTFVSNTAFQSFVANTNAYVATKTDDTVVLATNTALRTLIDDRMQVANVVSYTSKYLEVANVTSTDTSSLATWAALIATNTSIRSAISTEVANLVDSSPSTLDTLNELAAALGDDANFSATVTTSLAGKAANSYVNSTFVSNTAFQSFVANTNAYIAASAGSGGLSNTEVENIVDARINVLDLGDVVGTDGNAGQILISYGDGTAYWSNNNPSVDLSGYVGNTYLQSTFVSNTAFQSFVANTNAYIAASAGSGGGLLWDGVTNFYSNTTPDVDTNPSANGSLWVDNTTGAIYICTDNTTDANIWTVTSSLGTTIQIIPYAFQGSNYGYTSGETFGTTIDKFPFSSDGNASDVGDLTVARNYVAGQSSATYGYTSGGQTPTTNTIDKFPFTSDANATDVGDLTVARQNPAGHSVEGYGYTSGGWLQPGYSDVIDQFSFSSDGNATDVGNLSIGRFDSAGQSSSDYGYSSGGYNPGYPYSGTRSYKFPFSSAFTYTSTVGELTISRTRSAGQSSSDYGYTSGGFAPPVNSNVIDKFPFATDANATDVGNLTVARHYGAGQSSTDYGYTSGGSTPTTTNVIDKFSFSSDGNATDVGDLTTGRYGAAGQQY